MLFLNYITKLFKFANLSAYAYVFFFALKCNPNTHFTTSFIFYFLYLKFILKFLIYLLKEEKINDFIFYFLKYENGSLKIFYFRRQKYLFGKIVFHDLHSIFTF